MPKVTKLASGRARGGIQGSRGLESLNLRPHRPVSRWALGRPLPFPDWLLPLVGARVASRVRRPRAPGAAASLPLSCSLGCRGSHGGSRPGCGSQAGFPSNPLLPPTRGSPGPVLSRLQPSSVFPTFPVPPSLPVCAPRSPSCRKPPRITAQERRPSLMRPSLVLTCHPPRQAKNHLLSSWDPTVRAPTPGAAGRHWLGGRPDVP